MVVSSLFAGFAWSEMSLNIFRGIQGLGSALIAPAALSMVMHLFNFSSSEKAKALIVWGLSAAARGVFGIVFGGLITGFLGWRWTQFIYIPLSIIVLVFSPKLLQKSGQRLKGRIDYIGAVLVTASLMLIVYGYCISRTQWLDIKQCFNLSPHWSCSVSDFPYRGIQDERSAITTQYI
ncbi:MFS transporter [Oceanobacillus locisalsi]|uniref:MFS transporter n=1 Tax=Oceanobacillus locisalsi TaxID=546107 RepID=A0ABW3NCP6_9BACI